MQSFIRVCREIAPDVFIDIGANLGLYTCIVMKNGLAPRAILFEPDRRNRVHLRANFLINDLLAADIEINEVALGAAPGNFRLVPGPERDIGLSQIVENAAGGEGYDVEIVRLDDLVALSGLTLAIKIDIERYERKALVGMARTLRDNRGCRADRGTGSTRRDRRHDGGLGLRLGVRDSAQPRIPKNLNGLPDQENQSSRHRAHTIARCAVRTIVTFRGFLTFHWSEQ